MTNPLKYLNTTTINLNGTTYNVNYETTNAQSIAKVQSDLEIFQNYAQATTPIDDASAAKTMNRALTALKLLLIRSNASGSSTQNYLNLYSGQSIQDLYAALLSLKNGKFTPDQLDGAALINASQAGYYRQYALEEKAAIANGTIISAKDTPITYALQEIANLQNSNHGIQSLIETEYVTKGNDLLSTQLSSLQDALSTTQGVLTNLGSLQQLHNQIAVNNLSTFQFNYAANLGSADYINAFQSAANAYFNGGNISPGLASSLVPPGNVTVVPSVSAGSNLIPLTTTAYNAVNFFQTINKISPTGVTYTGTIVVVNADLYSKLSDAQKSTLENDYHFGKFSSLPGPLKDAWISNDPLNINAFQLLASSPKIIPLVGTKSTTYALVTDPAFDAIQTKFNNEVNKQDPITQSGFFNINFVNGKYELKATAPTAAFTTAFNQFFELKASISAQLPIIRKQTPAASLNDPNSLLGRMSAVLTDINKSLNGATKASSLASQFIGFQKWALDNYDKSNLTSGNLAGSIQNDLTFAITAAQNLNDTQKQSVQSSLFLFEEYYKSASSLLTKISQIIERMAQGMVR